MRGFSTASTTSSLTSAMKHVKEHETDLNVSNQTRAVKASCGTRSRAAYGYVAAIFIPANIRTMLSNTLRTGLLILVAPSDDPIKPPAKTTTAQTGK